MKNIQSNNEAWILIKVQCVIYQWIRLDKLSPNRLVSWQVCSVTWNYGQVTPFHLVVTGDGYRLIQTLGHLSYPTQTPNSNHPNSHPSRFRPPQFRPLPIQTPPDSDPSRFRPLPIQTPPDSDHSNSDHSNSDHSNSDHSNSDPSRFRPLLIQTTPDSDHSNSDPSRFRSSQFRPLQLILSNSDPSNSDHPTQSQTLPNQTPKLRPSQFRPPIPIQTLIGSELFVTQNTQYGSARYIYIYIYIYIYVMYIHTYK